MKIIVLNLPRETTAEEVSELFKPHGKITSCQLVMDNVNNKSKGFGFVEMNDANEANAAISALHGKKIGENKIRVKISDQNKA